MAEKELGKQEANMRKLRDKLNDQERYSKDFNIRLVGIKKDEND